MNPQSRVSPLLGLALALLASAAVAQTAAAPAASAATPRVDQRQANQQQRIASGVASGQLNQREARRMQRQQNAVAKAEDQAKADGTVTTGERRKLDRMQDRNSRHIARQKHDRQHAASAAKP